MTSAPLIDLLRRARDAPLTADDAGAILLAATEGRLAVARRGHGRPSIDDAALLAEMIGHVEGGASVARAALLVARAHPGHAVEATATRLARKFRRTKLARN